MKTVDSPYIELRAEIGRLRDLVEQYDKEAQQMMDAAHEVERLQALIAEAADILDGDGEYPETARRFRRALKEATVQSPEPVGKGEDGID